MSDNIFRTVVRLKANGFTWAEVATQLNMDIVVLEDLPWQDPARWQEAMAYAEELRLQECTAETRRILQATLQSTAEPATQARVANALVRLHALQHKAQRPAKPQQVRPHDEDDLDDESLFDTDADFVLPLPIREATPVPVPAPPPKPMTPTAPAKAAPKETLRATLKSMLLWAMVGATIFGGVRLARGYVQAIQTPTPPHVHERLMAHVVDPPTPAVSPPPEAFSVDFPKKNVIVEVPASAILPASFQGS